MGLFRKPEDYTSIKSIKQPEETFELEIYCIHDSVGYSYEISKSYYSSVLNQIKSINNGTKTCVEFPQDDKLVIIGYDVIRSSEIKITKF